jgi:hypothetical protein
MLKQFSLARSFACAAVTATSMLASLAYAAAG